MPAVQDSEVAEAAAQRLDPRVVTVWRVYSAGLVALASAVLLLFDGAARNIEVGPALTILATVVVGAPLTWFVPLRRYRAWTYRLRDDCLELGHGVVVRRQKVIPYFRVQHVDISQGPVDRRLGLGELVIHTASAATRAKVPGLASADADSIRTFILARTGLHDGV